MMSVLLNVDLLGRILCSYEASQTIIDFLLCMRGVSKLWAMLVKRMLVDPKWMAPFILSGNVFIHEIHTTVGYGVDNWADIQEDDTLFRQFLQQMKQHTWHEPAQYNSILALSPTYQTTVVDLSALNSHLLLCAVNDAMGIHRKSLRVQKVAMYILASVFTCKNPPVFSFEHSRAVTAVTRALVMLPISNAAIDISENILLMMRLMLEQYERFQHEFRQAGAIELVVNYMKNSDCSYAMEKLCLVILMPCAAGNFFEGRDKVISRRKAT